MPSPSSLEEAVGWLTALDGQIRKYHPPANIREPGFSEKSRKLTTKEWETTVGLIVEHGLPCPLLATVYGFSFVIYRPGEIQGVLPEPLLIVEDSQFPFSSANLGFAGQEKTLRLLEPITHSRRNQELLAWSGFEKLSDVISYAY